MIEHEIALKMLLYKYPIHFECLKYLRALRLGGSIWLSEKVKEHA